MKSSIITEGRATIVFARGPKKFGPWNAREQKILDYFIKYLGEQYRELINPDDIMEGLPNGLYMTKHLRENRNNCWSIFAPRPEIAVGGDRIVAISKETGKVVCDQIVGE